MIKNTNKFILIGTALAVFGGLMMGERVLAQISFTNSLGNFPGGVFTIQNLVNLIRRLACYFLRFGIICVTIAFVVYGISFLTSRGNPQGFSMAKKSLTWGLIGGIVIFGVFTIILSVASLLGINFPITNMVLCT